MPEGVLLKVWSRYHMRPPLEVWMEGIKRKFWGQERQFFDQYWWRKSNWHFSCVEPSTNSVYNYFSFYMLTGKIKRVTSSFIWWNKIWQALDQILFHQGTAVYDSTSYGNALARSQWKLKILSPTLLDQVKMLELECSNYMLPADKHLHSKLA